MIIKDIHKYVYVWIMKVIKKRKDKKIRDYVY